MARKSGSKKPSATKGQSGKQLPTLDLHGFRTDAVEAAVDKFLVKSQQAGHARVRLITGIGTGAVRKVALDWLKLGGFPFSKENEGSFLIFLED